MILDKERLTKDMRLKRIRLNFSYRIAADQVGVSLATYHRTENGKDPDIHTFGKICGWLKKTPTTYFKNPSVMMR